MERGTHNLNPGEIMIRQILWAAFFLALAGCGPVIQTHYDYMPPKSSAGMQCIDHCQYSQSRCQEDMRAAKMECRARADYQADREYSRLQNNYIFDLQRHARNPQNYPEPHEPHRPYPSYFECDTMRDTCLSEYHMCYRSCGGQIRETQVCTANCDQK